MPGRGRFAFRAILNDVAYPPGQLNIHAYRRSRAGALRHVVLRDMPTTIVTLVLRSTVTSALRAGSLLPRFRKHTPS